MFKGRIAACLVVALLSGAVHAAAVKSDVADAAMQGNKSAVRALLQQKADVNAPQIDGTAALQWAVQANDAELTDTLIHAGANVSAANKAGANPLQLATLNGNAPVIEKLIAVAILTPR
jgi:ankyrin repeat protein